MVDHEDKLPFKAKPQVLGDREGLLGTKVAVVKSER